MDVKSLRKMRKARKMPQNAVAQALGCSRSRISEAENGWIKLNYEKRQQFLKAIIEYTHKENEQ